MLVSDNLMLCSWFGFSAGRREQGCPQRLGSHSVSPCASTSIALCLQRQGRAGPPVLTLECA